MLELHGSETPRASPSCTSDPWKPHLSFQLPDTFVDANADGWWETVLQIDLRPSLGCSCAILRVHFADPLDRFVFNIGDSASNDGYGGDAGTDPLHSAEIQLDRSAEAPPVLSVYSASGGDYGQDRLLALNMSALGSHFLEIEVCDQFVGFSLDGNRSGPWAGQMTGLDSRRLFAIGGPDPDSGAPDSAVDPWIYAAFNRVIHRRRGSPSEERFGSGVERVEILLTP